MVEIKNRTAFELYSSIVKKTPVLTGRARGNWMISIGSPSGATDDSTEVKYNDIADTPKAAEDEPIYIENNLPYITVLEYGGYPKDVKYGTWMKRPEPAHYEIRSENGFSKQAPQGMVGLTLLEYDKMVKKAIEESEK